MQLDVDIEPTLRSPHMTSIENQMDDSEGYMVVYHDNTPVVWTDRQTDSDA